MATSYRLLAALTFLISSVSAAQSGIIAHDAHIGDPKIGLPDPY